MSMISLIIPVYNVEPFLETCLDSVVNQTRKPDEVILINDGSTDNSQDICRRYSELHGNIVILSQENRGFTQAIYRGLDHATGDYICFVDSDDYIELNMIELLHDNIEKEEADICKCNVLQFNNIKYRKFPGSKIDGRVVLNGKKEIMGGFVRRTISTYTWDGIYKRELFEGVDYRHIRKHANMFILPDVLLRSNKVVVIPEKLYFYRERRGSIVRSFDENRFYQLEGMQYLRKVLTDNGMFEDYSEYYYKLFSLNVLRIMKDAVKYNNYETYLKYYNLIMENITTEDVIAVSGLNILHRNKKRLFDLMIHRRFVFFLKIKYIKYRNKR